jgi:hypothetical protein
VTEKIVGYGLLIAGIVLIVFALFSVWWGLTGKLEPYQFVVQGNSVLNLALPLGPTGQSVDIPLNLDQMMPIAKLTNTFVHIMLMGFVASIGAKIANIGVNLVRPIIVKVKES